MLLKLNFRQRLYISFSVIFIIFTILVLAFQFQREKGFRKSQLESQLEKSKILEEKYSKLEMEYLSMEEKYLEIIKK